jgi:hypothetical protein
MSAVKLRDFFENQWQSVLWADRKAQILSNIKAQTYSPRQQTSLSSMRSSWYFKTATTAALVFMVTYLLYSPVSGPLFQQDTSMLVARNSGVVQAGYVGTLLSTQGQISVVRQWITTTTSQLQWWDVVYLYNTSKADFVLRDGSHGSIEWPAQLTIVEHEDSGLILSVDHARYMKIDKNNPSQTTQDPALTTTSEDLVIETSTSRISTDKHDNIQLALVTTQERQFIQNQWDDLTIESIVPNTASPITQQLASSHVAEVTHNVKVYEEVAMIYDELKTQSTSQTYDLTSNEFATNDLKTLLAMDIQTQTDTTQSTLAYQPSTPAHDSTSPTSTNDLDHHSTSYQDVPVYRDTSDNTDTSTALLAMSTMTTIREEQPVLARQDSAMVWDILSEVAHTWSKTSWETQSQDTISPIGTIDSPLDTQQIRAILSLKADDCLSDAQVKNLAGLFGIGWSGTTLTTVITTIKTQFYLTPELKAILTTISACNDDQN